MNKIKQILLLLVLIMTTNIIKVEAQLQNNMVLDKIIARVGRMEVMQSDIDARLLMAKQQNPNTDITSPEVRKNILETVIDEKVIIEKALRDSIPIAENQITQRWKMHLQQMISQYGSEQRIEQLYGMSIAELRTKTKKQIRDYELSQGLIQSKFANLKVSQNEVEQFYAEYKDSLPLVPKSIDLFHIVKDVIVKDSKKEDVHKFALKIRDSILMKSNFSDFAKKYSDDTYSKEDGGNLGWFETTKLFPEFVKVAQNLQTDEVSMPIETPLGYHIIQTLEKTETKLNTRHILFKIGKTEQDKALAMDFLKSIKDSVNDKNTFENYAKRFSDDKDTKGFGGSLGVIPIAQLPTNISSQIIAMKDGEISDPMPHKTDSYQILYKKRTIEEHKSSLTEDYKALEQYTKMTKKDKLLKIWLVELRKEIYWEYVK